MSLVPCPECGTEVSSAATSCPKCGHPLKMVAQPVAPTRESGPFMATLNIGCVIVLAIIGFIIVLAVIGSQQ